MLKNKTRLRPAIGLGVFLALILIFQGVARLASGGMMSLNYFGQPLTAVGSILLGILVLALLPLAAHLREKHRGTRDR